MSKSKPRPWDSREQLERAIELIRDIERGLITPAEALRELGERCP